MKDPSKIKTGIEGTRNEILDLLNERDMSIKEISEEVGKDGSTIYRHIKKLKEADYVRSYKDENGKNIYSRQAHTIFIDPQHIDFEDKLPIIMNWTLDIEKEDLKIMDILGYENECSDDFSDKICEFYSELDNLLYEKVKDRDFELENADIMILLRTKLLAYLLIINKDDKFNEKYEEIFSKFEKECELDF